MAAALRVAGSAEGAGLTGGGAFTSSRRAPEGAWPRPASAGGGGRRSPQAGAGAAGQSPRGGLGSRSPACRLPHGLPAEVNVVGSGV